MSGLTNLEEVMRVVRKPGLTNLVEAMRVVRMSGLPRWTALCKADRPAPITGLSTFQVHSK